MIVPMIKYSFLIHHNDYEVFLNELQEKGVLDVVDRKAEPTEETLNQIQQLKQYERVIRFLKGKQEDEAAKAPEFIKEPSEILDEIVKLQAEYESLRQKTAGLLKQYNQAKPWGDFSVNLVNKLAKEGVFVRFFMVAEKKFNTTWTNEFNLEVISLVDGLTHFVIVQRDNKAINIDAEEMKMPERSANEVLTEKNEFHQRIDEIELYFKNATSFLPVLEEAQLQIENRISFTKVIQNTGKEAENHLMVLEGWLPTNRQKVFEDFLDQRGHFYFISKATPDENVPVLLKNNRFAKLFEPIGNLYSLPTYSELDLTPFFAPWFMLFFGFCMGDVGYGLIVVLASLILKKYVSSELKPILSLGVFLGLATILFGFISGTIAGFEMEKINAFNPVEFIMLNDQTLFYLALGIGMVQILFGLGIQAYAKMRQFGFQYAVSTIGIIIGTLAVLDLTIIKFLGEISMYFVYLSLVMIIFWSDPKGGFFGRLGKGVWDLYGVVTGIFGDVLSYIRLFALGASSGILGFVINSISLPLLDSIPVLGPILFIIVMIVGHGANLALAGLGAFVHPMRLTFVEFYKNSGFLGGGKAYKPFKNLENR